MKIGHIQCAHCYMTERSRTASKYCRLVMRPQQGLGLFFKTRKTYEAVNLGFRGIVMGHFIEQTIIRLIGRLISNETTVSRGPTQH